MLPAEPQRAAVARPPGEAQYVQPGGVVVARAPAAMATIVGSCVAVCVRDTRGEVGGMVHYVLPQASARSARPLRYASQAIPELTKRLLALLGGSGRLEAKIVGGASVLCRPGERRGGVGSRNTDIARRLLAEAGVPVTAEVVGGDFGRRVIWEVSEGALWVQDLGVGHAE